MNLLLIFDKKKETLFVKYELVKFFHVSFIIKREGLTILWRKNLAQ